MEHECTIIDLAEERLKRYVDTFYQGSREWDVAMQVLLMYLADEIDVSFGSEGITLDHPSAELQRAYPDKAFTKSQVILPPAGPAKKEER